MRVFYSILFYLALPIVALRLYWRGKKAPAYRLRWRERFGYYAQNFPQDVIWFHAVSVGEAEALFPLVQHLQKHYPAQAILITTTTPTGSARVKAVLQDSVSHVYLPYDVPFAIQGFMRCFKPRLAVIMETEIWPNLFLACGNNAIPLYLINARLSEKSARAYQKLSALIHPVMAQVTQIAAQSEEDAQRFIAIGAKPERVKNLGNIKFDMTIPQSLINEGLQLKVTLFKNRFVWLLASTHKDEEELFLDNYKTLKHSIPELLLVIVPRHPERFADVQKLCIRQQLKVVMRTRAVLPTVETDVYIADTMGELKMLYAAADVAFVGGSMVATGGHNILEALVAGVPVLFGPFMFNFKEIVRNALSHQAAIQCQDKEELMTAVKTMYEQPSYRAAFVEKGKAFVRQNQGALERISAILALAIDVKQ